MSEIIFEALYLSITMMLGWAWLTGAMRLETNWIVIGLSFPAGFILMALIVGIILLLGLSLTYASLSVGIGLCLAASIAANRSWKPERPARIVLTCLGLIGAAFALAVSQSVLKVVILTFDSYNYAAISGNIVANENGFASRYLPTILSSYSALVPFGYAPVGLIGEDIILSGPPAFVISIAITIAGALRQTMRLQPRWIGWGITIIAVGLWLTTPQVQFHGFYIMPNLPMSAMVLGAVLSLWAAGKTDQLQWYGVMGLFLLGAGLCRLEGALFVVIIMLAMVTLQTRYKVWRLAICALVALILNGWMVYLAQMSGAGGDDRILSASDAILQSLLLFLPVAACLVSLLPKTRPLMRFGFSLLPWVLFIAGIGLFWADPEHGRLNMTHWSGNMTAAIGLYGWTWVSLAAISGILFARRTALDDLWPIGITILSLVLLAINLGFYREFPYRLGAQDSGNRIMLQILPSAILFVSLWAAAMFGERDNGVETHRKHDV